MSCFFIVIDEAIETFVLGLSPSCSGKKCGGKKTSYSYHPKIQADMLYNTYDESEYGEKATVLINLC